MSDELVDIVDEAGKIIRQASKHEAHKHGWLHKTVIGYVRREDKWSLVKQAPHKQDAGQLVAPVGGHVQAGETELDALFREAEEEIGTRNIQYRHIGAARFHRQVIVRDENHLFVVFEIAPEEEMVLGDEAVSLEQFSDSELLAALIERPDEFGDGYYFVLEHFYPEFLPRNYKYRWATRILA